MVSLLLSLLISMAFGAEQNPSWFCIDESGQRNGNVLWACGVGEAVTESAARQEALEAAFHEYHAICAESSNCQKKPTIEPKRLSCIESKITKPPSLMYESGIVKWWKCYRLIEVVFPDEQSN